MQLYTIIRLRGRHNNISRFYIEVAGKKSYVLSYTQIKEGIEKKA